jgi:hypothetical protein
MRKLITLMLAAGAIAVPAASASPLHGKPSGPKPCHGKAMVMVVLKGTFVSAASNGLSFQLNADHANRYGRPYLKAPQPLTITVNAKTRYVKNGADAKLSDLAANDRLVVTAKVNRCALKSATTPASLPALTARMVVDQGPAKSK